MTCDRAQREASGLLDGETSLPSNPDLASHLDACDSCRRFHDLAARVAAGYRAEVRARVDALRALDRRSSGPARRRPLLAAAMLLGALLSGLLAGAPRRPVRDPGPPLVAAAPSRPATGRAPAARPLVLFQDRWSELLEDDRALPATLRSDPPELSALDRDVSWTEWMRALPARLAEEIPAPLPSRLPTLSSEES